MGTSAAAPVVREANKVDHECVGIEKVGYIGIEDQPFEGRVQEREVHAGKLSRLFQDLLNLRTIVHVDQIIWGNHTPLRRDRGGATCST